MFETVMLQAVSRSINAYVVDKICLAKALGFIKKTHKPNMRRNNDACILHHKANCEDFILSTDDEFVFVHYYDVRGEQAVHKDGIAEKLNFIRLK